MKKKGLLFLLMCMISIFIQAQESLTLTFTGQIGDGYYQQMNRIGIKNVTRDWVEILNYPDTILTINNPVGIVDDEDKDFFKVAPNPFYGETYINLTIKEKMPVVINAYRLTGEMCSRFESNLCPGNYYFKVNFSNPQLCILTVQIGEIRHSVKTINTGYGSDDCITLVGSSQETKEISSRGDVVRPFQYGDVMEYVGYATINGSTVSSEHKTQSQFFDEDIILHFLPYVPTIQTDYVENILQTTATCGGEVVSDGWAFVTSRGVCWNTEPNPTVANPHTNDQNGLGHFTSSITGLSPNTVYFVRAYATNSAGTAYGNEYSFRTEVESIWPNGTLPGLFSVDEVSKVQFSQGNLQYRATTNTWRFADTQYEIIGEDNVNKSPDYDGYIDLFGWGTSGFNHGANCYQPWAISSQSHDYYAYGSSAYNLFDINGKADWGYNPIINGGNQEFYWRTLTNLEWNYILNLRETNSGIRFAKVRINETMLTGTILLPDDWDESIFWLTHTNDNQAAYYTNPISIEDLNYLEVNGAVFLPSAGLLYWDNGIGSVGIAWGEGTGYYWTSTKQDSEKSIALFGGSYITGADRDSGFSVRLARTTVLNK